jgi:two-component system, NarL family, response regulator LiaR
MTDHLHEQAENQSPHDVYPAIRVLIADDHPIVRSGIASSLAPCADLEVVARAGTGEEAVRLCRELRPDVVLMDLMMPGEGGLAAIRLLHQEFPEVQILALTSFREGDLVEEALVAGAIGYLLKDVAEDELIKAIRLAHQGVPTLAPAAGQALVKMVSSGPPGLGHDLTEREQQVLSLMAQGLSNQQIADQLVITPATVKFHARSIRSKLGTASRTETVVLALQHHLVPTRPEAGPTGRYSALGSPSPLG